MALQPLVIDREFHGLRPDYQELSEEFRLFHRLYHDRKQDRYYKIDGGGNEHVVAIIKANRIQIRLKNFGSFSQLRKCISHSFHG